VTRFVATWISSQADLFEDTSMLGVPQQDVLPFMDQTVRYVIKISAGGRAVRLKLSNIWGESPAHFRRVRVARSTGGSAIDLGTDMAVTFGGEEAAVVPPRRELWSDLIEMSTERSSVIAVSLAIGQATSQTGHRFSNIKKFTAPGHVAHAESLQPAPGDPMQASHFLSEVDVVNDSITRVIVAVGDSLTDGSGSTHGQYQSYPDQLSARVLRDPGASHVSVVNAGSAGNRLLHAPIAERLLDRFERDVLGVSGVTDAIVLIGVNDLIASLAIPEEYVDAYSLVLGLQQLIEHAHSRSIRITLCTLTPLSRYEMFTPDREAVRQEVNEWIRSTDTADGCLDLDLVVQDPADPLALRPEYDLGDGLHLSDEGYAAVAAAVELESTT